MVEQQTDDQDGINLRLAATADEAESHPICGESCAAIPVASGGVLLRSRVIIVEKVTGLIVPSAALTSTAEGKTIVITEQGKRIPVKVVAGARGRTVIEGIAPGTRLRAPAE